MQKPCCLNPAITVGAVIFLAAVTGGLEIRAASSITVMPPALLEDADVSETPPAFGSSIKPRHVELVANFKVCAYVIALHRIDETGIIKQTFFGTTHDNLAGLIPENASKQKFKPAARNGKPVPASCYYAVIYNPKHINTHAPNAPPRITAVAPVIVSKDQTSLLNPDLRRQTIWASARIDASGALIDWTVEQDFSYAEIIKPAIDTSLKHWRFTPARINSQPAEGALRIPLVIMSPPSDAPSLSPKTTNPISLGPNVAPQYPRSMRDSGIRANVTVQFTVDIDGNVKDPIIVRTNNDIFNQSAISAIRRWKFKPATREDVPVAQTMQIDLAYDMNEGDGLGGRGKDMHRVESSDPKAQEKLPEGLRFDIPPKIKSIASPVYPHALLAKNITGKATVGILLDDQGRVSSVQILDATRPEFGESAIAAACAHTFQAAMNKGKPTASTLKVTFVFNRSRQSVPKDTLSILSLESKNPSRIIPSAKLDAPPKPKYTPSPSLPKLIAPEAASGEAVIELLIDKDGMAQLPRIVSATTPMLGYAAAQALSQWRFETPLVKGKPVVTRVRIPVNF